MGLATVPADLVLLVGVLGNVSEADVASTVAAMPGLCAPGATLLPREPRTKPGGRGRLREPRFATLSPLPGSPREVLARSMPRTTARRWASSSFYGAPAVAPPRSDVVDLRGLRKDCRQRASQRSRAT